MKVLLCQDVERWGWLGDIVEVSSGYARNYLLPQALAVIPSQANIKALAEEKARRAEHRRLAREKLERIAQQISGAEAVVAAKTNEQGHLFGSVNAKEIGKNLRDQGFEVSDDMIQIAEHIKEVGTHEITVKLAADLTAKINVVVVSQEKSIESVGEDKE